MCQGALGLSTGLFYAPQSFATTNEVVALAREAGMRGGIYDSHIRDESSYTVGLLAAIDEAIAVGRDARLPVNISHIKALGVDVHGQAPVIIAKVEAAQRAGQKVTADQYPWSASGTSLVAALVPLWAQDGGRSAILKRFDDPALAARLRTASSKSSQARRRGVPPDYRGRAEGPHAGAGRGPAWRRSGGCRDGGDPRQGSGGGLVQPDRSRHRRLHAAAKGDDRLRRFDRSPARLRELRPQIFRICSVEEVLTLREFIERSTALTAHTFRLTDRGRLRPGAYATSWSRSQALSPPRANYEQPTLLAEGVRTVLVKG
jgi:N-acyl-D-aspartate/D-glutamate deacylase